MQTVYLMRHSIPEKGKFSGGNSHLSVEGICLASSLKGKIKADIVYSSDLARAKETAELLFPEVVLDERLRERAIGDATHDFWFMQYKNHDYKNPGGESLNEVKSRMKNAIDEYRRNSSDGDGILVVSHATAVSAYLLNYLDITVTNPDDKIRKFIFDGKTVYEGKFHHASYFVLKFQDDEPVNVEYHCEVVR